MYLLLTAPMMPVRITRTAVNGGNSPSFSETPIAIAVVTDFGASESSVDVEAPSSLPRPTAEKIAGAIRRPVRRRSAQEVLKFADSVVERHRQRNGSRAQKEVDGIRALKVCVVGRPGHQQQC